MQLFFIWIIKNEKGFKWVINSENDKALELNIEINIINQNIKFVIQLDKTEKNINEMYNNSKKLLELYIKKLGTEILNKNNNVNIHMYNEEIFPIKKEEELDLINEGCKKNLNKKIRKMKLLYKVSRGGDSADNFHKLCDNISNTLAIVKI